MEATGSLHGMSEATRTRLARLARVHNADPAEAALLIAAEAEPDLDVDAQLLRVDALADGLRTAGPLPDPDRPAEVAARLAGHLGATLGFRGDEDDYHDPANALLHRVLDRRRGLPITLTVLYVAVAHRLHLPVFPIALPGHVVAGVAGAERPLVIDPFRRGILLDEHRVAELVRVGSRGQLAFRRSMLRPTSTTAIIRRILDNLTRDYADRGQIRAALWTVELKHLLPLGTADDHRVHGELLFQVGRYRAAAEAFETYVEQAEDEAPDVAEVRREAIRARAKLN